MSERTADVVVIGAGTAGLAAERSARRAGATTLLIDPHFSGTTCARVGCMPSKLLIAAARIAHDVRRALTFGVNAGSPRVDSAAVMMRVRRERDAFVAATMKSIEEIPVEVRVKAHAKFVSPTRIALDDCEEIACTAVVIATGSRPNVPPLFNDVLDRVLTNETLFELSELPRSIGVVGAGPLGLELAQALVRLGVRVRVFDENTRLAGLHDEQVTRKAREILQNELPLTLGVKISASRCPSGVVVSWHGAEAGEETFDRILVATGRPPVLHGLNLQATGLALDAKGVPVFDPHTLRCGQSNIFLAGDAAADRPVLHEASCEGAIAGGNAATYPRVAPGRRTTPFALTFTDPPIAVLGAPEKDAALVVAHSYDDQGRAVVEGINRGLVRLYADHAGRIVGGALCAPGADHLAHLIAWAIERGESARSMLELPIYHPTLEEGLRGALREICDRLQLQGSPLSDEGSPSGA